MVRQGGLGDGPGNGMVGAGRQTGRQRTDGRFIFLPRAKAVGLARLAVGEGAGLVQGQAVEASALFQEHAALDEDAVAGGGGHAADDAHRRGDDQGAGAADDQYHQRGIDGVRPGAAQEQGRHQGGQQGHQEDGRGVVAREGIHKALHGGAAALGLFHGMDDAGQRGVRGRGGHPEFKGAGGIEGPGVDRVPGLLFHRHALAGDGRLVHQGTAVQHQTVQGDLFAGAHAHTAAHGHRADVGFLPAAVLSQHRGRIGRQGQQVLDGVAGPVQGLGLDGFRDIEQHHDHGGFRELPDEHGPGDGHGHEGIDVQVEVGDGQPALAVGGQAAQQDGDEGAAQGQERQHGPAAHAPGGHVETEGTRPPVLDEFQDLGKGGKAAGHGQPLPGDAGGRDGIVRLCRTFQQPGAHVQSFQSGGDGREGRGLVPYAHMALHQVDLKAEQARQALQGLADEAFFRGAVHAAHRKDGRGAFGGIQRLRRHVDGLQGRLDGRGGRELMLHGEHALHEVEGEAGDAGHSGQLLPDERLFHGAVHVEDAVHGARGGRGRQRAPVHGLGRVMAAAAGAVLVRMVVVAAFVVMRMAAFRMGVRVVAVSVVMAAALVAVVMAVAAVLVAVVFVPGGQGGMKYLVTYEAVRVPGTAGA